MTKIERKSITAKDRSGYIVTVDICLQDTKHTLTKDERDRLIGKIADDTMTSIAAAPYIMTPLHKIKVR